MDSPISSLPSKRATVAKTGDCMPSWTEAGLRIAFGGCAVLLVSGAVLPASAQQASVAEPSALVEKSAAASVAQRASAWVPGSPRRAYPAGPTDPTPTDPTCKELPDSPGVTLARLQPPSPVEKSFAQSEGGQSSGAPAQPTQDQQAPAQPSQAAPQPATPKPEGTAAAGANPATGVAASQPAGMAIAPAKQHRTRTLVLRTGAILGAGVALGSVFALTRGTPSKPPGAH
jgi:hypothetical protein